MKYAWIAQHRQSYSIATCCRVLGVSRSGFYAWRRRGPSARAQADAALTTRIRTLHHQTREAYGSRKIQAALKQDGVSVGKHRIARLRREAGIVARRRRRFLIPGRAKRQQWMAPNQLNRDFSATAPDRVWVGDITFIGLPNRWLYLAVLVDLYARRVVGWSMSNRINQPLIMNALDMAIQRRQPAPGLIHHSDQGALYSGHAYRDYLARRQITPSMSRKGNCWDNAVAESFFSTLKNEPIWGRRFESPSQAKSAVFDYIEVFYNRQRLHQSLNYQTPENYERKLAINP